MNKDLNAFLAFGMVVTCLVLEVLFFALIVWIINYLVS